MHDGTRIARTPGTMTYAAAHISKASSSLRTTFAFVLSFLPFAAVVLAASACGSEVSTEEALEEADALVSPTNSPAAGALASFYSLSATQQLDTFRRNRVGVTAAGCNAVAFAQVDPGSDLFLGRELNSGTCAGTNWSLTLNRMVNGSSLQRQARILDTATPVPVPGGRFTITTAYDPSTVVFGGQRWVAFECHGVGFGPMAASCAGPLSDDGRSVDRSRVSVLVDGGNVTAGSTHVYSASVPKLLVHGGSLYLYWSAVHASNNGATWVDITTRGIRLAVNGGRLFPAGRSSPIKPNDPSSVEVWGTTSSSRGNTVADVFQVVSDGSSVYAIAGVGGSGCLTPSSPVTACYRLAISRATSPLAARTFNNGTRVPDSSLPANPQEYTRLAQLSDGSWTLMGMLLAQSGPKDGTKYEAPAGFQRFRLPATVVPPPPPAPTCSDRLTAGQSLLPGDKRCSSDGRFQLIMQGDGNLVLYTSSYQVIWASYTQGRGAYRAVMQGDGNLVIYTQSGTPLWWTGTQGNAGAWFVVQSDANLVVYSAANRPLWASYTSR